MHRAASFLLGPSCLLGLLVVVYRPVLFEGGRFAGASTSHFDPLYQRVQQEWDAGRWPLWDPGHNGGMPLLGDPMAAVLYPGKVIQAMFPSARAARLYVIAHAILACTGLVALARSCGLSRVGSWLGGLSYAFGGPVLALYGNPLMLVGSAWIPWGLRAIDCLVRQGRRRGMVELAVVLALQVLDGDVEAAYLTVVCGAGYALVLTVGGRERPAPGLTWPWGLALAVVALGLAVLGSAWAGSAMVKGIVLAAWAAAGLALAWSWYRRPAVARLAPRLAALAGAGLIAMTLSAVQLLPVLEFSRLTWRAGGIAPAQLDRYSLDPCRVVELAWPGAFGIGSPENRSWLQAVPPAGGHEVWVESLYMGGLTLVLALGAAGWRGGPLWRAWLTTVALVALAGSLGKYASPPWWAGRAGGSGSPYRLLVLLLPGFDSFRYPAKLATFTAVALAVLAGWGWDRLASGDGSLRRLRRLGLIGLGASVIGLVAARATGGRVVAELVRRIPVDPMFGPADAAGAWTETQRALGHGAVVFAAAVALARWGPRRPRVAGAVALVFLTADLAVANARLVRTVPQAEFETLPEAARRIEAAERSDPSSGPFRVHRMPGGWLPGRFAATRSPRRTEELTGWARESLYPLFALPLGFEYCTTIGSLEIDDYTAFFSPRPMPAPADVARALGIPPGQPVAYFPRRSFDLWGARYFILPATADWSSPERGIASFLDRTELVHPSPEVLGESRSRYGRESWGESRDWQLRRNRAAYPRAWLVHHARVRRPASDPESRARLLRTLLFMDDPIWREPGRTVLDLRQLAVIETADPEPLMRFLSPTPVGPAESVTVTRYEPQRVELRAALDRPGLVILADTYYPGWRLTIDGRPAPIYRANRMMRGAAVSAGEHTLVYTYEPASFRIGAIVSLVGLVVLGGLAWSSRRDRSAPLVVVAV